MAKKKEENKARPIDTPLPEPNRKTIRIKSADNGGYIVEHDGVSSGKYYSKTHIARNKKHMGQIVKEMAYNGT